MDWDELHRQLFPKRQQITDLLQEQDSPTPFDFGHATSSLSLPYPFPEASGSELSRFNPIVATNEADAFNRPDFTYKPQAPVEALEKADHTRSHHRRVGDSALLAKPTTETVQSRRTRRETKPREHVSNPYGRKGNKRCEKCRKWRQKASFDFAAFSA